MIYDKQLEYIATDNSPNGSFCIDLGFVPDEATDSYEIIFQQNSAYAVQDRILHCNNGICEFYVNGSGYFSFHRASSNEWTPATTEMPNVNTQVTWFIDYKNKYYTFNGVRTDFTTNSTPRKGSSNLFLFKENAVSYKSAKINLHRLKYWRDGELIRDMIPADSDNVAYLYDYITDKLYGNTGSKQLILGFDFIKNKYLYNYKNNVEDYIKCKFYKKLNQEYSVIYNNLTEEIYYNPIIHFEDPEVKRLCVQNWGGLTGGSTNTPGIKGELTYYQASQVSTFSSVFTNNKYIKKFNEFIYFKKMNQLNANAFSGCTNLEEISEPYNLGYHGQNAFNGCSSLKKVTVESINSWLRKGFHSAAANPLYYAKYIYINDKELTHLEIPNTYTSLNKLLFNNCLSLQSVVMPDTITSLGESTFENCRNLETINMSTALTSVGYKCFTNCVSLSSPIVIPSGVKSFPAHVFQNCTSLTSLTLPEGFTSIGESSIRNTGISQFTIPSTVKTINYAAFNNNKQLLSITIPSSITTMNNLVFQNCTSLQSVVIEEGIGISTIPNQTFQGCTSLTSISIPEGITSIGNGAFRSCSSITSITLPSTITSINSDYAFGYCTSLISINLPNGLTTIGNYTFNNSKIQTISIPDSVTTVGTQAFRTCTSLVEVTHYPLSVIGSAMFNGDTSLAVFDFSNTETIGGEAFRNTAFVEIYLPKLVSAAGGSFYACSKLEKVIIGPDCTTLSGQIFAYCPKLLTFICLAETPPTIASGAPLFGGNTPRSTMNIYVPDDSVNAYKTSWSSFASRIEGISEYTGTLPNN